MLPKLKVATLAILALLVLIVVLQNTESVETEILFFRIIMPRAALLFGALVVGFVIGVFTAGRVLARVGTKPEK